MRQMLPVTPQRRPNGPAVGPGFLGRRALAVAVALAVSALVALGASCSIVVGGDSAPEPTRDEAGQVTEEGDVSVFHLRLGDCTQGSALGEIASVGATPCDQPHDYEVFAIAQVAGETYDPATIDTFAQQACTREFAAFVGVPVEDSVLAVTYLTPSANSFAQGDREVACLVGSGAEPTTGTLRGAQR